MEQLEQLKKNLAALADGGLCIAFSGGVDSAVLLKAACAVSPKVHAVTLYTPFHSLLEPEEAAKLAADCGAVHSILTMEAMPPDVLDNPPNRCYLCKHTIFQQILEYAHNHGLSHVLDGTNADDLTQYRPGLQALAELKVISPLARLGLTKTQVRAMAAELGLSVAKKPSAPCLATRFPYDHHIDLEELRKVEKLETLIKTLGPRVVRVRVHGGILRLEVAPEELSLVLERREAILQAVEAAGFPCVTLDLAGFQSGSMDKLYNWNRENAHQ